MTRKPRSTTKPPADGVSPELLRLALGYLERQYAKDRTEAMVVKADQVNGKRS